MFAFHACGEEALTHAGEPAVLRLLRLDVGAAVFERGEQPGMVGVHADAVGVPGEFLFGNELEDLAGDAGAVGVPAEAGAVAEVGAGVRDEVEVSGVGIPGGPLFGADEGLPDVRGRGGDDDFVMDEGGGFGGMIAFRPIDTGFGRGRCHAAWTLAGEKRTQKLLEHGDFVPRGKRLGACWLRGFEFAEHAEQAVGDGGDGGEQHGVGEAAGEEGEEQAEDGEAHGGPRAVPAEERLEVPDEEQEQGEGADDADLSEEGEQFDFVAVGQDWAADDVVRVGSPAVTLEGGVPEEAIEGDGLRVARGVGVTDEPAVEAQGDDAIDGGHEDGAGDGGCEDEGHDDLFAFGDQEAEQDGSATVGPVEAREAEDDGDEVEHEEDAHGEASEAELSTDGDGGEAAGREEEIGGKHDAAADGAGIGCVELEAHEADAERVADGVHDGGDGDAAEEAVADDEQFEQRHGGDGEQDKPREGEQAGAVAVDEDREEPATGEGDEEVAVLLEGE